MLVLVCGVLQSTESRLLLIIDLDLILIRGNTVVLKLLLHLRRITVLLLIILVHGIARCIVSNSPTATIMTALSHHQVLIVDLDPVLRGGLRTIHLVV